MSAVFLDLDGTLTDSRPGILSSLRGALADVGRKDLAGQDLDWMIGPPFQHSFSQLGIEDIPAALVAYRKRYVGEGGMFDNAVYDGVFDMLAALRGAGFRLYVATAKPNAYARQITAHFGLAPHFLAEFGPELDGTHSDKADLLAHALVVTGEEAATSIMVGDRHHDIHAARSNGLRSIAVTWGYGTAEEHALADLICDSPANLPAAIASLMR